MAKKKGGFLSKIFNFLMIIFLLVLLIVGGFAAGIYFQAIDSEQVQVVNEKLGLYKLPVVGELFDVPEGVVWPEPVTEEEKTEEKENKVETVAKTGGQQSAQAEKKPEPKKSKEVKVSQKDIEAQMQEREKAEKKRISKLARIYESMKPDEAANALVNMDLDTAVMILQKMNEANVGQILAKMDAYQAAQISQMLFEGTQSRVSLPPATE